MKVESVEAIDLTQRYRGHKRIVRGVRCRGVFQVVDRVLKESNAEEVRDAGLGNTEEESGNQLLPTLETRGTFRIISIQYLDENSPIEERQSDRAYVFVHVQHGCDTVNSMKTTKNADDGFEALLR